MVLSLLYPSQQSADAYPQRGRYWQEVHSFKTKTKQKRGSVLSHIYVLHTVIMNIHNKTIITHESIIASHHPSPFCLWPADLSH